MLGFFDFITSYGSVATELSRLLGQHYIPGDKSNNTPVGRSLADVFRFNNERDYAARDEELLRLSFLAKHLREIEAYDAEMLAEFARKLHSSDWDQYYGARAEVYGAACLVRTGVRFRRGKPPEPDFVAGYGTAEIGVECGSAFLRAPRAGSVSYKIGSVINSKARKPYCCPTTALFIDCSNILYNSFLGDTPMDTDELRVFLQRELAGTRFGGVVLFMYLGDPDASGIRSVYIRVDAPSIDLELAKFLDCHFRRDGYSPPANYGIYWRG